MSGESRPRPHVVYRYRAMLPPENRRSHNSDTDDRFAPPGQPARTLLGRYCDRVLAAHRETPMPRDPDVRVVRPDIFTVDGHHLTVDGERGHTGHPSVIVLDLTDEAVRFRFVLAAAVYARELLDPAHIHTSTRPAEAIT